MSASFRNGGLNGATAPGAGPSASDPKATHKFTMSDDGGLNNDAYEAAAEHPPILKFAIGMAEVIGGIIANVAQVWTSSIAIQSMILMGGTSIGIKSFGHDATVYSIASLVGFGLAFFIQVTLHMMGQSMSSTWARLRSISHFNIRSSHAVSDVKNAMTFRTILGMAALMSDIVSDSTFMNMLTHNWFVILMWIVFCTGVSTIVLYDGTTRIWGAKEDAKDYHAYHSKHDPKEK